MKNVAKHAEKLKPFQKKLLKDFEPPDKEPLAPLPAVVRGILSFDAPESKVESALKSLDKEFVDLNELRVATELELVSVIGPRYPHVQRRATMLRDSLNGIFADHETLNLQALTDLKRKETQDGVSNIAGLSPYVESFVMLYGFDAPAVPTDDAMLALLRDAEVVEPESTAEEAQKFLEDKLKADEMYPFFAALRERAFQKE